MVGTPSPEVTEAFCRVPSASFSQAPWYTLPVHLCRFRYGLHVGAISWNSFAASLSNPIRRNNNYAISFLRHYLHWCRNINLLPIDYAFRPRLRGRLTLRGLALRRNPWTFGEQGFSPSLSLLMSAFSLLIPPESSRSPSQAYRTLRYRSINCARIFGV